jgi:hypothetical protein
MAVRRKSRNCPQDEPDEAILAIARALAIRHAREDHAAEQARLSGRALQPQDR